MRFKTLKTIGIIFAMLALFSQANAQDNPTADFDRAFVHVVYFWLNNPDDAADRMAFENSLNTLLETSEYTKTNYVGTPPKAIREVVDDSFSYCLIVTFESAEAQEAYQVEPAHLKFIEDAGHLWNKVVVYDAMEHKN